MRSHTATAGRSPDRRHCPTRYGVHTTARGRRARGSSALAAGLPVIRPRRIAAFSAARSVARILPLIRCQMSSTSPTSDAGG